MRPRNPYDLDHPEPRGTPAWREDWKVFRAWLDEETRGLDGKQMEAFLHQEGIGHFPCGGNLLFISGSKQ